MKRKIVIAIGGSSGSIYAKLLLDKLSNRTDIILGVVTMIVCPCSMGLLSRITHGISNDLITRTTDVILKERRKLIVVPREMPYSLIHLRNMTSLTEAGAIICPATPSYYSKPSTLEEIALTVVDRVIDLAGIDQSDTYRWGEK